MENQTNNCLNCQTTLEPTVRYCANCGQKRQKIKITLWSLTSELFYNIINIDSAFWKTFKAIFIPGRLTKHFFKGKRKSYIHPVRLFFALSILFFAIFSTQYNDLIGGISSNKIIQKQVQKAQTLKYIRDTREEIDSAHQAPILDTLLARASSSNLDSIDISIPSIESNTGEIIRSLKMSYIDIANTPTDTLMANYKLDNFLERLMVKQGIRLAKGEGSFADVLLQSLSWMLFLMLPILALFLKLIYFRKGHYLVEHLVFLLHVHAFIFLILTCSIGLHLLHIDDIEVLNVYLAPLIILPLYLLLAMRYYGQGWIKTFIKFLLFCFSYLIVYTIALVITTFISFLLM